MMLKCPLFPENHDTAAMAPADVTVLEWQIARLKWLEQQHHQSYFAATPTSLDLHPNLFSIVPASTAGSHTCSTFVDEEGSVNHDLLSNMSPDLIRCAILGGSFASGGEGSMVAGDVPDLRTFNCPPELSDVEMKATPSASHGPLDRGGTDGGRESSRKRKAAHLASNQEQEDDMDKRPVGDDCYTGAFMEPKLETPPISSTTATATATTIIDGKDSNPTSNKEASRDTNRENYSKVSEQPPKTDYIHVRARRGQATDSHSLAERVRREKISKRMKLLQDLVPGCNKITGKAGVLDEIINYVQSLQRQVEFLSMKLAAVSPTLDAFFSKEMIPRCGGMAPSLMGMPPPELLDASFLAHVNTMETQQAVAAAALKGSSIDVAVSASCSEEQATLLRRTTAGEPVLMSEHCSVMDSHKVPALAPTSSPWEADLYGHYSAYESQQGLGGGALPSARRSNFPMLTTPRH